ncbi:TPA: hypothetical protein PC598_003393 [Morganella morganii]|nr:hypothetical protein [Morganella morganii]
MSESIPDIAARLAYTLQVMEERHGPKMMSLTNTVENSAKQAIRQCIMILHSYDYELNKLQEDNDSEKVQTPDD